MKRNTATYSLSKEELQTIKLKMLNWANQFSISVLLDNNEYSNHLYHQYELLLGVDAVVCLETTENEDALTQLAKWHGVHKDWLFGHISYEYGQQLFSKIQFNKKANFQFPPIFFFCPKTVCYISSDKQSLTIETYDASPQQIFDEIQQQSIFTEKKLPRIDFQKRLDKEIYLEKIAALKEHIRNGDCYEINFCNEGFAQDAVINPTTVFNRLNNTAPAPFTAFYKYHHQYLMCSSPERYLCKQQNKIISQPIKGTIKRSEDEEKDMLLKQTLLNSEKDRAENVMIVDLTRNDLAMSCETGSVQVEEPYGIYSYPRVHQMISTVTGLIKKEELFTQIIRNSFPMGSMTGAPKLKVMQLIEQYENSARELFSGSIGYITPDADFDFNVIIRSLFYNAKTNYLSYQTGGAITYDSVAEQEWEETLLKAENLENIFKD